MNTLQRLLLAAAVTTVATPALAANNLTGSYLLTVTNAKPTQYNGATLCATLVEDGSVLGLPNSGTVTIDGTQGSFFTRAYGFTAEIPLDNAGSFITFSGVLGHPQIQGTSFIEVINGKPVIAGTFTAVSSNCASSTD